MGAQCVRPFLKLDVMKILRVNSYPEEGTQDNCVELGFSASPVADYSIVSESNWADASINENVVTITVQPNATSQTSANPPTWTDRAAQITLTQLDEIDGTLKDDGNKINIGIYQSGKGYEEGHMLSGNPIYSNTVRASESFVDVTWNEVKCWRKDTDPTGPWSAYTNARIETYRKAVVFGTNPSSSHTETRNFSFLSANGVEVTGSVIQSKNTYTSAITHFDHCVTTPNKIFWGRLLPNNGAYLPTYDESQLKPSNAEDDYIAQNSSLQTGLTMTFTPMASIIWEVYNEDYITEKEKSPESETYKRPIDDNLPEDYIELLKLIQEGLIFLDVETGSTYAPVSRNARIVLNDLYVFDTYHYYPEHIIRDFNCGVIFKEKDINNEYVIPPNPNNEFSVKVYAAIVCESDYSGNTMPNPIVFYQQQTYADTGTTDPIDEAESVYWPQSGVVPFSYEWKRRYFYSYPSGDNVEMKDNVMVFSGGSTTNANTKVANAYFRISKDFTASSEYDFDISVTDNDGNTIAPVSGKTMDETKTRVLYQSMDWYPCSLGRDVDTRYTRYINFTITRKPKP